MPNQISNEDIALVREWVKSPIKFIESIWGIVPERDNAKFIKGKHLTWQQHDILLAVENALKDEGKRKISVASGHGIGKSATISWLLLWFLFVNEDAQIACTAPTSQQMYDVLWKEVNKWIRKMPKEIGNLYDWTTSYVRIKEKPEIWFARAATARKEAPEALAGIHGDAVMILADEASGIDDVIFDSARGALTEQNIFVILISNPTRLLGYFYDTHNRLKTDWQTMQFSSLDSPLVAEASELINEITGKYGEDSDEYRIRVLGKFPRADSVDDKGYVPLLEESDLHFVEDSNFTGTTQLGVDPAGEGSNKTAYVVRDRFKAKIAGSELKSTDISVAQTTLTLMHKHQVKPDNTTIDNFGAGANIAREIAIADEGRPRVNAINVGYHALDQKRYINKRAENYFRLKEWLRNGGELVRDERWRELLSIRYRRNLQGKIQIMSKEDMRKAGFDSPDFADALMMTFDKREIQPGAMKSYRPKLREFA